MKFFYLLMGIMFFLMIGAIQQDKFPQTEITNGIIRARFYLPDSTKGSYQATRFDWSGNFVSLEYKGHQFYGKWFDKFSPTINDAVRGPVEEFDQVGYREAKVGGRFIKIGVGSLVKPEESTYNKFKLYKIANHGKWDIITTADQIQFIHRLNESEYSYEYSKTIQFTKGKPEMVLIHTLKNTGKKTIETDVYDHNFLAIDNQIVGLDYRIQFPFKLTGNFKGIDDMAKVKENQIQFLRDLNQSESFYCNDIYGFGNSALDYDIRVENMKALTGVRITADKPISKLIFWSAQRTICPEPFIKIKVEPGQEFSWRIVYEYYMLDENRTNTL